MMDKLIKVWEARIELDKHKKEIDKYIKARKKLEKEQKKKRG